VLFKSLLPKINFAMRATKFARRITKRQLASCLNHEQTLTHNRLLHHLQTTLHTGKNTHKNHHKYYAEVEYKLCLKINVTYYSLIASPGLLRQTGAHTYAKEKRGSVH